jgi:DNA-binding transcriptional ArsR family regulator
VKDIHKLADVRQVRAVADPLRLRILEAFRDKSMTTKQVATLLGEKPTRLYHHVELLERAGLIRLVKTRRNRGTVERYYRSVAVEFIVDRGLLELSQGAAKATRNYESLFLGALEATLAEARNSVSAKLVTPLKQKRNALMFRHKFSGTEAEIGRFMDKVSRWIHECQAAGHGRGGTQYGLTIAFYPVERGRTEPRSLSEAGQRRKKQSKHQPR